MIKETLATLGKKALVFTNKNASTMLTVAASIGVVATSLLVAKAVLKTKSKVDEMKENAEEGQEVSKKELVKETWYYFVPPVLSAGLTIGAVIAANQINLKNQAALLAAYTYGEKKLEEYQDKVVEILGKNGDRKVRDALAADKIKNDPVKDTQVIVTGNGDMLCYDALSGRYFMSTPEKIRQAANIVNTEIISTMWADLNSFYCELGLQDIGIGEKLGFTVDQPVDIDFSTQLTDDERPCLVMDFRNGLCGDRTRYL